MSWVGMLQKAGITSDGTDVTVDGKLNPLGGIMTFAAATGLQNIQVWYHCASVGDETSVTLPGTASNNRGFWFVIDRSGGVVNGIVYHDANADTVTLMANHSNFVKTDDDGKLCFLSAAGIATVKNRLGEARTIDILGLFADDLG